LLLVTDPNLLAHAGLATNDLPVTAAVARRCSPFGASCRPTTRRALLAGLVLGVAQGTKLNTAAPAHQVLLALAYGFLGARSYPVSG
jgi:hypothetical protein